MLDSILGFVLIITPLVFFHELGHFLLARFSGVHVEVFSVGFGREIAGFTDKNNTRWRLSLIPLGGYVKMKGEGQVSDTTAEEGSFASASLLQRMATVAAGPIANIILALVLLFSINLVYGVYKQGDYGQLGIGAVSENSAAFNAGLQEGDIITALDGNRVSDFNDIITFMTNSQGAPIQVTYVRGDTTNQHIVTPTMVSSENAATRYLLGVSAPKLQRTSLGIVESFNHSVQQSIWLGSQILFGLGGLVSGAVDYNELGGPIKIAQYSGDVLMAGVEQIVLFAAMLSVNLALINMLPIPGLDGGHLLLMTIEGIFRRPPSKKVVTIINNFGILSVCFLILLVSVKDVYEIFL